jgi:hypothetical protein
MASMSGAIVSLTLKEQLAKINVEIANKWKPPSGSLKPKSKG